MTAIPGDTGAAKPHWTSTVVSSIVKSSVPPTGGHSQFHSAICPSISRKFSEKEPCPGILSDNSTLKVSRFTPISSVGIPLISADNE